MKKPKKVLPPKGPPVPRRVEEDLESLEIPNHLVTKSPHENALWPLLMLRRIAGDRDDYLFVSKAYGEWAWPSSCEHPPTWMDPEMLVRIARKDPAAMALVDKCQKLKSKSPAPELAKRLEELFIEVYLPYITKLFMNGCAPAIADWLIANRAWKLSDPQLELRK